MFKKIVLILGGIFMGVGIGLLIASTAGLSQTYHIIIASVSLVLGGFLMAAGFANNRKDTEDV